MPITSAFTSFGMLRFSSKPSRHRAIYDALKVAIGGDAGPHGGGQASSVYDLSIGTHQEAKLYATAHGLAMADGQQERAGNQALPLKCVELLPSIERDYLLVPGPYDTIAQQQANLQARKLLPGGAILSNIVAGLRLILGTDFLAVRTITLAEGGGAVPSTPVSDARVNARLPDVPAKWVQLTEPVTTLAAPFAVGYGNLDPTITSPVLLAVGDVVMVQAGNTALMEKVTVSAVSAAGAPQRFTATFAKSHDVGAVVTTMDWPWQVNPSRIYLVIVTAAAAKDAERRRKVDEFMARVVRGPSQWATVKPTTPGALTVGPDALPFTLGAVPIGSLAFTLSP